MKNKRFKILTVCIFLYIQDTLVTLVYILVELDTQVYKKKLEKVETLLWYTVAY